MKLPLEKLTQILVPAGVVTTTIVSPILINPVSALPIASCQLRWPQLLLI